MKLKFIRVESSFHVCYSLPDIYESGFNLLSSSDYLHFPINLKDIIDHVYDYIVRCKILLQ